MEVRYRAMDIVKRQKTEAFLHEPTTGSFPSCSPSICTSSHDQTEHASISSREGHCSIPSPSVEYPKSLKSAHMQTFAALPLTSAKSRVGETSVGYSSSSSCLVPPFSTSSGFCTALHSSSSTASHRPPIKLSFFSKSVKLKAPTLTLPAQTSHSGISSVGYNQQAHQVQQEASSSDPLQDFLNFSDETSQCNEIQVACASANSAGGVSDWETWSELVPEEDSLATCWTDLLGVESGEAGLRTVCQNKKLPAASLVLRQEQQGQALRSATSFEYGAPVACGGQGPTKPRLRWTPELHDRFVEAINQLGGPEKATPKAVVNKMSVEGLTIYHVKSHLQKYRVTKYIPDSAEGKSEKKKNPDNATMGAPKTAEQITEALQLQMEMQKRLHEQLEVQRYLQLRIEAQGKHLQTMFEQQQKTDDFFNYRQPVPLSRAGPYTGELPVKSLDLAMGQGLTPKLGSLHAQDTVETEVVSIPISTGMDEEKLCQNLAGCEDSSVAILKEKETVGHLPTEQSRLAEKGSERHISENPPRPEVERGSI